MSSRTVVVTGASRGLGRALTRWLAERGHQVAGCARSAEAMAELGFELGPPHRFESVDVRRAEAVEEWAAKVVAAFGAPDLVVNNAGLINANRPLWEVPAEEISRVVDVNLKGTAYVVSAFLPPMIERGSGVVVNFSSGWGRSTSPEVAPYCATKWGVEGLTRSLAQELPAGLAAVALNPGIIDTEMLRSTFGAGAGNYAGPEAWAESAGPFLLDLDASANGRALTVPGF